MQKWPGQELIVALFVWLLLPAGLLPAEESVQARMRYAMGFFDKPLNRSEDLFSELSDDEFALLEEYRQAYNRQVERAHNLSLKADMEAVSYYRYDVEPGTVVGDWEVEYAARFKENVLHLKLLTDRQTHDDGQMIDYDQTVTLLLPDRQYSYIREEMWEPRLLPEFEGEGVVLYETVNIFHLDFVPRVFPYSTEFGEPGRNNLLANKWRFQGCSPKVSGVRLEQSAQGEVAIVDWEVVDGRGRWTLTCRFLREFDWALLENRQEITRTGGEMAIRTQRCDYEFDAPDSPILRYAVIEEFERERQGTGAAASFGEPVLVERVEVNYHEYTPGGGDDLALYDPGRIVTDTPTGFHFSRSTQKVLVFLLLGTVAYYGWRHYRLV